MRRCLKPLCVLLVGSLACACARFDEITYTETRPVGPPVRVTRSKGTGFAVTGVRQGAAVRAEVQAVERCADVDQQVIEGRRRIVRKPSGASLTLEWIFGAGITAVGGSVIALNALYPPKPQAIEPGDPVVLESSNTRGAYILGGVLIAAGVGLLVGAAVQQASVGETTEPLGRKSEEREGRVRVCNAGPGAGAKVALTLPGGRRIEAVSGPDGVAILPLPADLDAMLELGAKRRATLDVEGDPRGAGRVDL